jgi:hypothetical protein
VVVLKACISVASIKLKISFFLKSKSFSDDVGIEVWLKW